MKPIFLSLALFCVAAELAAEELRQIRNFNRDWKFQCGDQAGAEGVAFNDSVWEDVGIPHSFSLPYFASDKFYTGYGWYRKRLKLPSNLGEKRYFLEFDGAFQVAEVFVNGRPVGSHSGGYTGFSIDITKALVPGENTVAVRVNNLWSPQIAPRAGEHVFSGGIYRNVRLVVTDPLHVAWYGTAVTTPKVTRSSAIVNVKTEVANDSLLEKKATVRTEILDPAGTPVISMESMQPVAAGATVTIDQTSGEIRDPKLWSPEHPELYCLKTTVLDEGRPVDDFRSPFGIRWFSFTADKGFFLNGEHRYLKGANVHQDHAGWGDAVTDAGAARDVRLIREAGMDFIRGSHYPHSPAFVDACDRQGALFWSENCFWGTGGFNKDGCWDSSAYPVNAGDEEGFKESVRSSLRDMIRIHRNHPSIIVWSMDNEVFFSKAGVLPKVREFLKELVDLTRRLDPTRPAAIGGCQRGEIDKIGDLAGYNGDGAKLFINPGVPNLVSEYGSTMGDRPGKYVPGWGDLPLTPGIDRSREYSWRQPWRSGEVIWCGFDHGSIAGKKFGSMGMLDYFRMPKRVWYWYRNAYRGVPPPEWPEAGEPSSLKLETDKATISPADGTDDVHLVVTVVDSNGKPLSNSPPVKLEIVSGPGEFPTGSSIEFAPDSDITIRDGKAAIEFRSYHAGKTLLRASSPGLTPAELTITSSGGPEFIPGTTPMAKPRSYVRFQGSPAISHLSYGTSNPTSVSSQAEAHPGNLGNDGNPDTAWESRTGDASPWWQVDLERIVTIEKIHLTFPTAGVTGCRVEVSDDGNSAWRQIGDYSGKPIPAFSLDLPVTGKISSRYIRLTFPGVGEKPASLSEIEVICQLATP